MTCAHSYRKDGEPCFTLIFRCQNAEPWERFAAPFDNVADRSARYAEESLSAFP